MSGSRRAIVLLSFCFVLPQAFSQPRVSSASEARVLKSIVSEDALSADEIASSFSLNCELEHCPPALAKLLAVSPQEKIADSTHRYSLEQCSGVVIDQWHVLTAGHCAAATMFSASAPRSKPMTEAQCRGGMRFLFQDGSIRSCSSVELFELSSLRPGDTSGIHVLDLAILKLDSPVDFESVFFSTNPVVDSQRLELYSFGPILEGQKTSQLLRQECKAVGDSLFFPEQHFRKANLMASSCAVQGGQSGGALFSGESLVGVLRSHAHKGSSVDFLFEELFVEHGFTGAVLTEDVIFLNLVSCLHKRAGRWKVEASCLEQLEDKKLLSARRAFLKGLFRNSSSQQPLIQ